MSTSPRIVVIGATGYTGRLVARELAAGETPFLLSGRDPERLARLAAEVGGAETQLADVTEPASLRRLLRPGDAVINCAGPFTDLGEPVVRTCTEVGAHYLDTTGEQRFMKLLFDRYDAPAREAGVVVIPSMAFDYAPGDCAAAVAAEGLEQPLRSVDVTYLWRGGPAGASRGTRRSILRIISRPGYAYERGTWRLEAVARKQRQIRLPDGTVRAGVSFPAGEVVMVPHHLQVRQVRGWGVIGRRMAPLAAALSPALPPLMRLTLPVADWVLDRTREGPSPEERRRSEFLILAEAVGANGEGRRVQVRGRDPYGLTAAITVHGALRVLERAQDPDRIGGTLAPAQLLEPRTFLDWLTEQGVEWAEEPHDSV